MTSAKSSSDIRSSSVSRVIPALATRTSTGPCRSSTAAKAASTCSASGDVALHRRTAPRAARRSGRSRRRVAGLGEGRAMASPIPRLPPVTRAERPTGVPPAVDRPATLAAADAYVASTPARDRPLGSSRPLIVEERRCPSSTRLPGPADAVLRRCRAPRRRRSGAAYAAFRFESNARTSVRLRDGRLDGINDAEWTRAYAVRVVVDGTWGFAADAELTPEAGGRRGRAGRRSWRGSAGAVNSRARRAGRRAGPAERRVGLRLRHRPVHRARRRQGRAARGVEPPAARRRRRRPRRRRAAAVKEHKFYADLAGTATTQQRVRLHAGGHRGGGRPRQPDAFESDAHRWPRRSAAAGSTSTGDGWDWDGRAGRSCPDALAEKRRRAVGRARDATTW